MHLMSWIKVFEQSFNSYQKFMAIPRVTAKLNLLLPSYTAVFNCYQKALYR
jgi:hypothetical protein